MILYKNNNRLLDRNSSPNLNPLPVPGYECILEHIGIQNIQNLTPFQNEYSAVTCFDLDDFVNLHQK